MSALEPGGKCTGIGEAEVHLADRGRTHLVDTLKDFTETLEDLAETIGIWPMADPTMETWPTADPDYS